MPAPMGGINTISGGSAMPDLDAVYAWNLVAAEYGLRARLGWREFCIGLTGVASNAVRTVMQFTGSTPLGSRLFACTDGGIFDVTTGVSSGVVVFGSQGGNAGIGSSTNFTTPAGRFLAYCDEDNGLYVYSEATGLWTQVVLGATVPWAPNTAYAVGNRVQHATTLADGTPTIIEYTCSTAGTSGATGPLSYTPGLVVVDGTVQWTTDGAFSSASIGPSLADQNAGFAGLPSAYAHVCVWKNRLWFTEKNSTRAWYLGVNSIYGTATSFDFGAKMRVGGTLVGLFNWSYDAGIGLDTLLVGLSTEGDVVIYAGTDPTSAATFGIKGCWFVGALPKGRRVATDHGGELLIMSILGVVSVGRLIVSQTDAQASYATAKIANAFNGLARDRRTLEGWALYVHPSDNALMVTVPTTVGAYTEQLVMSFATQGWTRYRDLPVWSAAVWSGELYFGTVDGRVCRNVDYVDGVTLASPTAYTAIDWSVLSAFRNLGTPREKQVKLLRPILLGGSSAPTLQAYAKYNYDMSEPTAPGAIAGVSGWDVGLWDSSTWDADYKAATPIGGAVGMGRDVAIAVRGSATSRTILVGVDVVYEQGGVL